MFPAGFATGGGWPRSFLQLDDHIAANQHSGEIVPFRVVRDGPLTSAGRQVVVMAATYIKHHTAARRAGLAVFY